MKRIAFLILALVMLAGLSSCSRVDPIGDGDLSNNSLVTDHGIFRKGSEVTDYVCIQLENGGRILIELYPDVAPITVANFQSLVGEGFYDGLIFHRVIKGFMIQGGCPNGNGSGGSGKEIKGEFAANGVENDIKHERGVVSMARAEGYNTASSQFFIMHADTASLDGQYAAFGRVLHGMDLVDEIAAVQTNAKDKPLQDQKIKSVYFMEYLSGGNKVVEPATTEEPEVTQSIQIGSTPSAGEMAR